MKKNDNYSDEWQANKKLKLHKYEQNTVYHKKFGYRKTSVVCRVLVVVK